MSESIPDVQGGMEQVPNACFVEFLPKDAATLDRAKAMLERIRLGKEQNDLGSESTFLALLTENERSYFWDPTPEEAKQWSDQWFATPLPLRHSSQMATPGWSFGSMLEAFANGDYELIGIEGTQARSFLTFEPLGYPYGGTGCMVALLECFGHRIVGIEDGTGYQPVGHGGIR